MFIPPVRREVWPLLSFSSRSLLPKTAVKSPHISYGGRIKHNFSCTYREKPKTPVNLCIILAITCRSQVPVLPNSWFVLAEPCNPPIVPHNDKTWTLSSSQPEAGPTLKSFTLPLLGFFEPFLLSTKRSMTRAGGHSGCVAGVTNVPANVTIVHVDYSMMYKFMRSLTYDSTNASCLVWTQGSIEHWGRRHDLELRFQRSQTSTVNSEICWEHNRRGYRITYVIS